MGAAMLEKLRYLATGLTTNTMLAWGSSRSCVWLSGARHWLRCVIALFQAFFNGGLS